MDKNKIIEAAAKLVAKGAYDKAIKEYQKILDVDPKDVRILQKMGELYQKKNDNAQAAIYFTKVAESYTNDGFFLKAVALYKQVLKLDPTLLEINIKLAELHQQLQLLSEAMAYFQIVANHYDKAGDTRKSLDVLKKMVDLDPDKVASRVKLADLYVREGMNAEAANEFTRAAEHLKRNNQTDDYVRVAERLSALQPDNLQLAKELAEIYLQRHDQKRALAKLQVCFKADNRDIDTLRLLAVAFQGLGQTAKTISVYKELARAWEEKGQFDEAEQVWQQVAALDPNDADLAARSPQQAVEPQPAPEMPTAYGGARSPVPQPQPSHTTPGQSVHVAQTAVQQVHQPAATTVQGAHAPAAAARPRGDNVAKLLTETDVYVKYGLHDKALEHLRKVFAVEPENIDAHEKAYAIYVASNNHAQAFEQLLNVLRLHTRVGDAPRAQPYLQTILQQNPGHPEVPVFLSTLGMAGAGAAAQPSAASHGADDGAIIVDSNDDDLIVADHQNEEVISAEVALSHEEQLGQDLVSGNVELAPLVEPGNDEYSAPPLADEPWSSTDDDPALLAAAAGSEDEAGFDSPFEANSSPFDEDEPSTGEFPMADPDELDTGAMAIPVQSVTTGDGAALASEPMPGLGDDTHEAPTRVTHRLDPSLLTTLTGGASPLLVEEPPPAVVDDDNEWGDARADGPTMASPMPADAAHSFDEPEPEPEPEPAPSFAPLAVEPPAEANAEEPAAEEVDEATFFVEQGLAEEAREILETVLIAYPGHVRATQLLAQLEAQTAEPAAATGGESSAFDLAQELADELGDEPPAQLPVGPDDYQVSVEEVFAEFKKGLEKVVKPEDVDTHYDLGVAYKEMGLIDDAVSEFTIARKGCLGKRKEVDCLSMIGLLQQLKGDATSAVDAFMQALTSEHASGDVEKSLRYDLASAYEGGGQLGRALSQFLRVQKLDPSYREVGGHVARLASLTAPEDDGPPARPVPPGRGGGGGARKVGYV